MSWVINLGKRTWVSDKKKKKNDSFWKSDYDFSYELQEKKTAETETR